MSTLKMFIDLFGSTILVPVVVFILSLFLKVKFKDALRGAIFMGIGLAAFNIILGSLMSTLGPAVNLMVENSGINLPVIDLGWPAAAVIVYANQIGLLYLVFGVFFDLFLFLTRWTDTFHPTDIWNYYQFVFWAAIVQLVTGSFWLGITFAMFANLLLLLIADWLAPAIQEYYGYDGITDTTSASTFCAPFAVVMKWVLMRLRIYDIKLSPQNLKEKFGFWGESVSMGLIIGLVIAIIANLPQIGTLEAWANILQTAIVTGAVMALYPSVSGLFVKGLIPISQTLNARIRKGEIKRKNFYISMDSAVLFGEEATLTTGLLLIPIMLLVAVVLPGNSILPLADLPAMPFMVIGIVTVMRGNILSSLITGTVWYGAAHWCNSDIAEVFTRAAINSGVEIASTNSLVTAWSVGNNPVLWLAYKAFAAPVGIRTITIIIAVAVYLVVYYFFRKNRRAWHIAAGASEEFLAQKEKERSQA